MTTTQEPQHQHYGPAHYPPMTPPPAYGGGLPPTGGPVPPALAGPGKPGRFRKGTVALSIAAVLAAGAVGGVSGALIGGSDTPAPIGTNSTPIAQNVGNTPTDVSNVASKVLPSVVQVNVQTAGGGQGVGSGVILTANGQILTNNHVVNGARRVTVTTNDGKTYQATVVGTDSASDLAVLQLQNASGLTPAALGDSGKVKIGDQVVAFGSPGGLQGTVTSGIVSALNRDVNVGQDQEQNPYASTGNSETSYKAIQTDASINQGNSGGPLTNAAGEVIGINSAIYSPLSTPDGKAGSVGIGFAIPINDAKTVIAKILAGTN